MSTGAMKPDKRQLRRLPTLYLLALGLALSLLPAGCLKREERIDVHPDGSIDVAIALKGDPGEFEPECGDALPSGPPWQVSDREVPREDGDGVDHIRTANAHFASASEIPESFGALGDPAHLRFQTSLQIEKPDPETVRYIFERRYVPRTYAWRTRLFDLAFPEELQRALERDEDAPPLSEDLKRQALKAILDFEQAKALVFLEEAMIETARGSADTLCLLAARTGFQRAFQEAWQPGQLLPVLDLGQDEQKEIEARFRKQTARDAARWGADALHQHGEIRAETQRSTEDLLLAAFVAARRKLDATEDLKDESFEIQVSFPVKIALSDAQHLKDDGRTAVFRFHGKDLCDREHVLRVLAEGRP